MTRKTRTAPTARDNETRETEDRVTEYRPPSNLPDPIPQDGYEFRWVRTSMLGDADNRNVSMRYREGWEPCQAEDHPELMIMSDTDTTYKGNVVIGGLMLCKCSTELMISREEYYQKKSNQQAASVDQNFMRENDPRMPLLETEHSSTVTFGAGRTR
ncbi:MAG: hypothetical protein HOE83_17135 [Alphaproteobacteria bacterium]|jgi:hypothetical protein|nr:hypothetical protein [Alphaproteobacteria bacterium]